MTALAIDTLQYAKRLKAAGVSTEQAEAQAEALGEAVRDARVTKSDLNEGIDKLRLEIRDAQSNLVRRLFPLLLGQTAAIVVLIKLF